MGMPNTNNGAAQLPPPCGSGSSGAALRNCLLCADAMLALAKMLDADADRNALHLDSCEKDGLAHIARLLADSLFDNIGAIELRGEGDSNER